MRTDMRRYIVTTVVMIAGLTIGAMSGKTRPPKQSSAATERDGQHDFDFNFGTWKTHVSRLAHPLAGSHTWVEYEGTSVVRKVWNGRASIFELEADGLRATSRAWACVYTTHNPTSGASTGPTVKMAPWNNP